MEASVSCIITWMIDLCKFQSYEPDLDLLCRCWPQWGPSLKYEDCTLKQRKMLVWRLGTVIGSGIINAIQWFKHRKDLINERMNKKKHSSLIFIWLSGIILVINRLEFVSISCLELISGRAKELNFIDWSISQLVLYIILHQFINGFLILSTLIDSIQFNSVILKA